MIGFIKRQTKKGGRTLNDWMELSITASIFGMMKNIFITVFMPWKKGEPGPKETFEEAVKRLGLTEEDIESRKKMFIQQTLIYAGLGFAILAYGVYLAFNQALNGLLLSLVLSFVAFANAFRAHFWYFQTKHRKLGCTLKEWLDGSVGGGA